MAPLGRGLPTASCCTSPISYPTPLIWRPNLAAIVPTCTHRHSPEKASAQEDTNPVITQSQAGAKDAA